MVDGSVIRDQNSLHVAFEITDYDKTVPVEFTGILPDLFREGQGIVAQGSMDANGVFQADEVLAKHDENYMPPEVAEALKAEIAHHVGAAHTNLIQALLGNPRPVELRDFQPEARAQPA